MTAITEPASMANIRKAQSVHRYRGALHREVESLPRPAGCRRVSDLLEDPPAELATIKVFDLIRWIDRIGKSQARSILTHADQTGGPIGDWKRLGALSERQRYAIADHLYEASLSPAIPGARPC